MAIHINNPKSNILDFMNKQIDSQFRTLADQYLAKEYELIQRRLGQIRDEVISGVVLYLETNPQDFNNLELTINIREKE